MIHERMSLSAIAVVLKAPSDDDQPTFLKSEWFQLKGNSKLVVLAGGVTNWSRQPLIERGCLLLWVSE